MLNICDPGDPHPRVNIRAYYQNVDFQRKSILSLSTFEHIGQDDINPGLFDDTVNRLAFEKLFDESDCFLVTVPGGYSPGMDNYLLALDQVAQGVSVRHLLRVKGNQWIESPSPSRSELVFRNGAYSLFVVSRGTFLETGLPPDVWFEGTGLDVVRSLNWVPCVKLEHGR